jgi:uncharacterized surface protein with fasciclin (FAS1) repeats
VVWLALRTAITIDQPHTSPLGERSPNRAEHGRRVRGFFFFQPLCFVAVLLVLLFVTPTPAVDAKSIFENIEASDKFTILQVALKEAGLDGMLNKDGPYTLFAPSDAAFKKLGEEQIKKIVADKDLLKKILMAHIITEKALTAGDVKSLDGKDINGFRISAADGLKIGDAKVVGMDAKCKNGNYLTIDTVLIPK